MAEEQSSVVVFLAGVDPRDGSAAVQVVVVYGCGSDVVREAHG